MDHPDYYRFGNGYRPIAAKTFEEAKKTLISLLEEEHARKIERLANAVEDKNRWSKCGCIGWNCDPFCPEYEVSF